MYKEQPDLFHVFVNSKEMAGVFEGFPTATDSTIPLDDREPGSTTFFDDEWVEPGVYRPLRLVIPGGVDVSENIEYGERNLEHRARQFTISQGMVRMSARATRNRFAVTIDRNNRIPFEFEAIHDLVFDNLPFLLYGEVSNLSREEVFNATEATIITKNEKKEGFVFRSDPEAFEEYLELWRNPEDITEMVISVRQGGPNTNYMFCLGNRLSEIDTARLVVGVHQKHVWTPQSAEWLIQNHVESARSMNDPQSLAVVFNEIGRKAFRSNHPRI